VYFQDLHSYQEGVRYGSATDETHAQFYEGSEEEISHVFNYEHALDELMRCALRRKKALSND